MKNILVINGSRTPQGNTATVLSVVQKYIQEINKSIEVTTLDPTQYSLTPVSNPADAFRLSDSIYEGHDDDYYWLKEQIEKSDALILASPAYYANVTSDMKLFIDRFCHLAHLFYWAGKPAGVIASADAKGHLQVAQMLTVFLEGLGMPRVANLIYTNSQPPQAKDIEKFANDMVTALAPRWYAKVTPTMESAFKHWKRNISRQPPSSSEYIHWDEHDMFSCNNLQEYINR